MQHVGLIGVGFIGKLLADDLLEAGYPLTVYDVVASKAEYAVERGAEAADGPAAVAAAADVLVLSLPGAPEVASVLEDDGALDELGAGDVLIDTTTTGPDAPERYEALCAERGVAFVTAPLTRGAADPGIHMLVGGTEENYAAAAPVIDDASAAHTRIGTVRQAQTFKLAIQLKYAGEEAIDAEVVAFAADNGVDPAAMNDFLGLGIEERYLGDDFSQDIEGLGGLRIWHKDIGYALELAHERGTATPLANAVHEAYKSTLRGVDDDEGHAAAIIRHWRALNGVE